MFKIELLSLAAHKTLKIILGKYSYYIDLYYYCLDGIFFENDRSFSKGLLNFTAMLENWKLKIKSLEINKVDFLPYDYSDEYVGFFIINKVNNNEISIQAGGSIEYMGCAINPSQLYLENFINKPYYIKDEEHIIGISQLLQDIDDSMINIFYSFYKSSPDLSQKG